MTTQEDVEREFITGILSKDARFRLIVTGVVGVKEIERLIKKLGLDKEIMADATQELCEDNCHEVEKLP